MRNKYLINYMGLISLFISGLALAAPHGGEVVAGAATISQSGNITTVNQSSANAVINWANFDTASNESVYFDQPRSSSTVLNRINSGIPTNFAGSLTANGKVFIVNPAGMVFAKGSSINAASFVATTSDINNTDFMNRNYNFLSHAKFDQAAIINDGVITADTNGLVALIAPNVSNSQTGIIQAHIGTVELASGKSFIIDFNADNLINIDITNLSKSGSVENAGKIIANGGTVIMNTEAVSQVLNNVMSMSGTIEASSARIFHSGKVELLTNKTGAVNISGSINATHLTINSGKNITLSGQLVTMTSFLEFADIVLNTQGSITETETGSIKTYHLYTDANTGINLNSEKNDINHFSANNNMTGNIYVKNNRPLSTFRLGLINQLGGDLTIINNGMIAQDYELYHTDYPMTVSGSTTITATGIGSVYLSANNIFKGPVSITSEKHSIWVSNSQFENTASFKTPGNVWVSANNNLILGNVDVSGEFNIHAVGGNIAQAPNTALNISGRTFFNADGSIILNNTDNKITGSISMNNSSGPANLPITLNNSTDTELSAITASGILTITTPAKLNLAHWDGILSHADNPPNGHAIILAGSSLYYGGAYLNPGANNSMLIYLPNPAAIDANSSSIHLSADISPLWETPYTAASPATISAGNHFIYSDKAPAQLS